MREDILIPFNENEAISDSLIKSLRFYDQQLNQESSLRSQWRRRFDNEGIGELRKLMSNSSLWGFLEVEFCLLDKIEGIVSTREIRTPSGGDELTKTVFNYLKDRLKYIKTKMKRTPQALTSDKKVLLVGNGWVHRQDPGNPIVRQASLVYADIKEDYPHVDREYQDNLNLKTRGYNEKQVYTVDINPAQIPDYTGDISEFEMNEWSSDYFDVVYFEGVSLPDPKRWEKARNNVFQLLKDEGLLLWHNEKGFITVTAKTGIITQAKLDNIPACVKQSVGRQYYIESLNREIAEMVNELVLERLPRLTVNRGRWTLYAYDVTKNNTGEIVDGINSQLEMTSLSCGKNLE